MSEHEQAPDHEQLERLRTAFAAATVGEPNDDPSDPSDPIDPSDPSDPIDPEKVWAAARGELDPRETAALVDRLHRDPQLALEWRLAVELSDTSAAVTPIRAAADRRYWVAGALALATAAAVTVVVLQDGGSPELDTDTVTPGLRGPEDTGGEAAFSTPIAEGTRVALTGFELSWSARARASRYELQVRTEALDLVYEARELQAARARVPGGVLASLEPGRVLLWQVTAVMADGTRERGPAWRVVLE
ncbi:hypothetical protein DB30_05893 [Enhygromyxa salina]|uniref:Uncharacterized protein n=1 Tax=Enhygromyxa salina TaxID=215803 RepID=A0A0C1ZW00_9BACT|nr:hypothetical protein [Enhygromyxa salina]KIG15193.1 hypothetical protein DB30_05893 [Enhygromyxa salina]